MIDRKWGIFKLKAGEGVEDALFLRLPTQEEIDASIDGWSDYEHGSGLMNVSDDYVQEFCWPCSGAASRLYTGKGDQKSTGNQETVYAALWNEKRLSILLKEPIL